MYNNPFVLSSLTYYYYPNFSRFSMIHPCDRQTDGRTGDSIYAL